MPPQELSYILGNPPFGGSKEQSAEQKADMARVFADVKGAGVLDFVTAWYRKAADYMADNPAIKTAFVSTNSITQGEQVGVLWADLLEARRENPLRPPHLSVVERGQGQGRGALRHHRLCTA